MTRHQGNRPAGSTRSASAVEDVYIELIDNPDRRFDAPAGKEEPLTGQGVDRWIATRERPDGSSMTPTYAASMSGVDRATIYRWINVAEAEVRRTRTFRDFVEWMRGYDRANPARRKKDAPRMPDAVRI